jgi:hypothetical protein
MELSFCEENFKTQDMVGENINDTFQDRPKNILHLWSLDRLISKNRSGQSLFPHLPFRCYSNVLTGWGKFSWYDIDAPSHNQNNFWL